MWKVYVMESERGWGQRVDEVKHFTSKQEAEEFKKEFNSQNNLDHVPDWYMYADGPYAAQ